MKTTVEPLEGNKVKLSVEVDEAEFDKALDAAYRKIAHEVRIPGFRPGKAPRRILQARIGQDYARQQALQDALPDYYVRAVTDNDVDAIAPPELNLTSGAESGPVAFEATVETRPKVKVPGYGGLEATIDSPLLSDAEIDAQVDRMRNAFASITEVDRQAHPGDHARIDISGSIDGEAIPGLTATDYLYEVGLGSVVPELDAELTGAKAGDVLAFDAQMPGAEGDGPGTRIAFSVVVKAINEKVLPEVSDEWVATASEFSTVDELRADIVKRAGLMKRVQAHLQLRDEAVKALVALIDEEPPQPLIDQEAQRRLQDLGSRLSRQGVDFAQYMEATGQTQEDLIGQARAAAVDAVKADLALRAVADAESIEADADEIDAEIERIASRFGLKPKQARKELERSSQMSAVRSDVRKTKALAWLMENIRIVDREGHEIDRSDLDVQDHEMDAAESALPDLDSPLPGSSVDLYDDDDDHGQHDHDHHHHDHDHHDHQH